MSLVFFFQIPDPCYTHPDPSFLEGPVILRVTMISKLFHLRLYFFQVLNFQVSIESKA